MEFIDVMQNIAIGIGSGIFSSIIVSVVFYILNEYQKELDKAKNMTYSLYIVVANCLIEQQFQGQDLSEETKKAL